MAYCLIPELVDKLKTAVKAGDIAIEKMYEMTSADRRALFEKYIDSENAKMVNTEFERAMVSNQQNALLSWAERTFSSKEKKTGQYRDTVAKIQDLDKLGILTPEKENAFLEDLVSAKLGVTVTAEEAGKISELSKSLETLSSGKSEFNTPTLEYFKARKKIDDYLDSLTPNSKLRVATETIGRGTMLASLKSPLLNIESNSIQGMIEAFTRRIQTRRLGGKNNGLAMRYIAFATKIYKETGYDVTRMINIEERNVRGEAKANTQGPGKIRGLGQMYEDVIFRKTQGLPDVAYSSLAFADRANIESTKIAQGLGLKGTELKSKAESIFKDATSITPTTPEGQAVRNASMADSMYSTYTNKSKYSDFALGIRKLFNIASGDMRIGDQIMPFVKTPANVIGAGIESSGILLPVDTTIRMVNSIKDIHSGKTVKEAFGTNFADFSRPVIRAGLGLTFAYALSSLFAPSDFIGEYPTTEKEKRLLELNNGVTNSVRIGGKWISLDYFGPLGAPLVGMLYAKKYGTTLPTTAWEYIKGVGRQAAKIPGFDEFYNTVDALKQTAPGTNKSLDQEMSDITNFAVSFVRARSIPSLVSDIAKGGDTAERKTNYKDLTSGVKSGLPGARETLPEKTNVFGQIIKTEPFMSVLLFGSRVKSSNNDPVITELNRLAEKGNLPSITDVSKTSTRAKTLKEQIGEEKFNEAMLYFGSNLKKRITSVINSHAYKSGDDEYKQNLINKVKDVELNRTLQKYHYRKPKK